MTENDRMAETHQPQTDTNAHNTKKFGTRRHALGKKLCWLCSRLRTGFVSGMWTQAGSSTRRDSPQNTLPSANLPSAGAQHRNTVSLQHTSWRNDAHRRTHRSVCPALTQHRVATRAVAVLRCTQTHNATTTMKKYGCVGEDGGLAESQLRTCPQGRWSALCA